MLRPATLFFEDEYQNTILTMRKPFRLYFHRLDVSDAKGAPLGSVRRRSEGVVLSSSCW
jgi:hypothetical protein